MNSREQLVRWRRHLGLVALRAADHVHVWVSRLTAKALRTIAERLSYLLTKVGVLEVLRKPGVPVLVPDRAHAEVADPGLTIPSSGRCTSARRGDAHV